METVLRYVELIVKPSTTAQDIREFSGAFGEPRGLSAELDFRAVPGTA